VTRFVVTIKLKPGGETALDFPGIWENLSKIDSPGVLAFHAGFDERRHYETNWSFAVVIDFTDFDSFKAWFDHPDHRRYGRPAEPYIADTSRVVYEIPG
jgi:Stress responsive A/B Barrel Domain